MTLFYVDTSALVRAYLQEEPGHVELRSLLLEGTDPVVTSEMTRLEFASAIQAAARSGRLRNGEAVLSRFLADSQGTPISLLRLRPETVLPKAYRVVMEHGLRTLDAIHLAVALTDGMRLAEDGEMLFVTRDVDQARAAAGLGFEVR